MDALAEFGLRTTYIDDPVERESYLNCKSLDFINSLKNFFED